MFTTLLVALDGGPQHARVLDLAAAIAGPHSRLHLLCVLDPEFALAADASEAPSSQYAVTLKTDGTLWLNGNAVDREALMASARARQAEDKSFSVILYADKAVDYGKVMAVLDAFKKVGVTRIGLVADSGAQP